MKTDLTIYIIQWEPYGMFGFFRGSDLEQCANVSREMVGSQLEYLTTTLYKEFDVRFKFATYEDIRSMREERGFEQKSVI